MAGKWEKDYYSNMVRSLRRQVNTRILHAGMRCDQDDVCLGQGLLELLDRATTVNENGRRQAIKEVARVVVPIVREAVPLEKWELMHNRQSIEVNRVLALRTLEDRGVT